jgi:hypothetical protein
MAARSGVCSRLISACRASKGTKVMAGVAAMCMEVFVKKVNRGAHAKRAGLHQAGRRAFYGYMNSIVEGNLLD